MSVTLYGHRYYRPIEACRVAGISKGTFLRWVQYGILPYTDKKQVNAQLDPKAQRMYREQGLVESRCIDQLKIDVKKVKRTIFLRHGKHIEVL